MAGASSRLRDLILPAIVVLLVGVMIFPLPIWILDTLLMCNISLSLVLLISAVYLSQPERFTSLPTILLLSTLFRLSLNISTSRQLLANGAAPEIVVTFGNFVVQGNLVVGLVIFVMITLVQFLVIAKGAERVAEVSARFTLDAMPGKQMAIDADIRSGILSLRDAKERRLELQREAKLYGALDGAMKFVKGDAIAGLLITAINITAGLLLGITQEGLSLADAASKYTLFTVGDGLASQIPALLVSVAAGIAVTRVSDREGQFVGRDIFLQLGQEPQVLGTSAFVLMLLAFVPGLPSVPFLLMAIGLGVGAGRSRQKERKVRAQEGEATFRPRIGNSIMLRISPLGVLGLQQSRTFPQQVQRVRQQLFERWGVVAPDLEFEVATDYQGVMAAIVFQGCEVAVVKELSKKEDSSVVSQRLNKPQEEQTTQFSSDLLGQLRGVYENNLLEMVNDTQSRILMEVHQGAAEDLINSVIPEMISVTRFTNLLRNLLEEKVSIRQLPIILQSVADCYLEIEQGRREGDSKSGGKPSELDLLASARAALRRPISCRYEDASSKIKAWLLESELDHLLGQAALNGVQISPELETAIRHRAGQMTVAGKTKNPQVIIASRYARRVLSELLREDDDEFAVLAPEEIAREVKLEIVATLSLAENVEYLNREESTRAAVLN